MLTMDWNQEVYCMIQTHFLSRCKSCNFENFVIVLPGILELYDIYLQSACQR
jgi:hypothetical protein